LLPFVYFTGLTQPGDGKEKKDVEMGFWEIFALVLTGSGTLSSILGIFFAIYAKQNGKVTREFIAEQNRSMTEFLGKILERIDEGFKRMDEGLRGMGEGFKRMEEGFRRMDEGFRRMDEGFRRMDEGFRRMDEWFRRMDERAEQRHQEVIRLIKSMDERTALISRQISEIPHKTVSLIK
jgi:hypothetical protein